MLIARPVVAAALVALVAAVPTGADTVAHASSPTCQGLAVTIEGAVGTEGDDVMRAPLDAWTLVRGLGGDDTICLVDGTSLGSRDPRFVADAGPGDDSVSFEATYQASVMLGTGADHFIGNDVGATVYTGAYEPTLPSNRYFAQEDTEADVVLAGGGRDSIYTGDTTGFALNPDRIASGGSTVDTDTVFYAGRMTPEGELDNGSSGDVLFLVGPWAPGELVIDNVASRADLDGTEVLRWSGVRHFIVDERPEALRFLGGPARERLTVGDYQLPAPGAAMTVDVSTRGGRDRVSLAGALQGRIRLGAGRDGLTLGGACDRTRADLRSALVCHEGTERSRATLAGIDEILVVAQDVVAIGTMGPDTITAHGQNSRVHGRGGPDRLAAHGDGGVVHGGRDRDRCSGDEKHGCEASR